ncbi:MAG: XdhC family protein [Pyrinomonadaceae bacterium]
MKEIQEILKKAGNFAPGEKAILATVADVVGSGYRRPGARMLIDENGYSVGTVSGGCLEADVLERARQVLQTGEPTVITYDTTADENSVFGLSMGCRGIVRILLEEVSKENSFFDFLKTAFEERKSFTMTTIISSNIEDRKVGSRLFLQGSKIIFTAEKTNIFAELKTYLRDFPKDKSAELVKLSFGEILFENINPPLKLLLFGAGYDALPLINFAKQIGWNVAAIDHRRAFANKERLPEADEIIVSSSENLLDEIFADETSVAVIMTHNYERDRSILRRLLHSKCFYIGALGPKKRTEKLLEEIGENFSGEQLKKLHAPMGLDIGADTPETIALAIVAEIQSVLKNRGGGFLRNRIGSIYDRTD